MDDKNKSVDFRKTHLGAQKLHPQTLMVGYGYDPHLSEGAVKPPLFLTSTFVFKSAEEAEESFHYVAGRKTPPAGQASGLVYSRFNHPNEEIVEDRLAVAEGAESGLLFASGMAAIATSLLAHVKPGEAILYSQPIYGGTETLLTRTLYALGMKAYGFADGEKAGGLQAASAQAQAADAPIAAIMVETPSNPVCSLFDLALLRKEAESLGQTTGRRPLIFCDNTLLGPVFQQPLQHGADAVIYSLTKYIGGHSDLVAGAVLGGREILKPMRALRSAIGNGLDPHSCWMVGRSLETVALRMRASAQHGEAVADYLARHPAVALVQSLSRLEVGTVPAQIYGRQCLGPGSTFSFTLRGGKAAAFAFLNRLQIFKLAVSLGGTESLACHPASTTHSGVPQDVRERMGVTDGLIRVSIGLEHPEDLIADLEQALPSA